MMKYPVIKASSKGDLPEMKRLMEERWKGASIEDDFVDEACQMDLHIAAENGNLEVCEYLIEELQMNVDEVDKYGRTPLHHACMYGNVHIAEYLLQEGANPNAMSIIWLTPLHYAVEKGPIELVELLLAEGAEINAKALTGTPLQLAVFKGQEDIVQFLLDNNADPNAISILLFYPLLDSINAGEFECMKLLLEDGADPNLSGSKGISPLGDAAHQGWAEAIEWLLEAGADPNVTDNSGITPLETAALKGCLDGVKILFPVTKSIPSIQDWSIIGVIRHVHSNEAKEERQRKMEEQFFLSKSKGTEAYNRADFLGAIKWYTEALYCKKDAAILSNLSACWARLNEGGLALLHAQMCIHTRPDWPKGHYRKGVALMLLKYFDEAADTFSKAFKMDPGDKYIERAYMEAATLASNWRGSSSFSPRMIS